MHFILSPDWEEGIADLTQRLVRELGDGKKVLWLVSGGSNIPASVKVMSNIDAALSQGLSVMLADERYGPVGHPESNWHKLLEAGFDGKQATLLPVLEEGLDFAQTIERFSNLTETNLSSHQVVIAQLGIGPDGHIAGILPDSPAAQEPRQDSPLVAGYDSQPYQRLTLTFAALIKVDVAYAFAFGQSKREALQTLQTGALELAQQPARILYGIDEAYVYNDQVGEAHDH